MASVWSHFSEHVFLSECDSVGESSNRAQPISDSLSGFVSWFLMSESESRPTVSSWSAAFFCHTVVVIMVTAFLLFSVHLVNHYHKVLLYKGHTVRCFNTQTYLHEWLAGIVLAETTETVQVCDLCSGVHIIYEPQAMNRKDNRIVFILLYTESSIQSEAGHNFKMQNLLKPGLTLWVPAGTAWVSALYTSVLLCSR